jgi:hypothetical protein
MVGDAEEAVVLLAVESVRDLPDTLLGAVQVGAVFELEADAAWRAEPFHAIVLPDQAEATCKNNSKIMW